MQSIQIYFISMKRFTQELKNWYVYLMDTCSPKVYDLSLTQFNESSNNQTIL